MYLYMDELTLNEVTPYSEDWFTRRRLTLVYDWVTDINREQCQVNLLKGAPIHYERLLIATGGTPRELPLPFPLSDHSRLLTLYSLEDLQRLQELATPHQNVVIIGAGLIGIEWSEIMIKKGLGVHLVSLHSSVSAHILASEEAEKITNYLNQAGVKLCLNDEVCALVQEEHRLKVTLGSGMKLVADWVGVAIGTVPNIKTLRGVEELASTGIIVDETLTTADPYIFAAGDCAERMTPLPPWAHRSMSGTWYEAKAMGREAAHSIATSLSTVLPTSISVKASPQVWFNSAKFFDVEYQEYGLTPNALTSHDHLTSLYWADPDQLKTVRLWFNDNHLVGICSLGVRLDHLVCELWIQKRVPREHVIDELLQARFETEFEHFLAKAKRRFKDLISSHS